MGAVFPAGVLLYSAGIRAAFVCLGDAQFVFAVAAYDQRIYCGRGSA